MKIELNWTQFKDTVNNKQLFIQYITLNKFYKIWACEQGVYYVTDIYINSPANDPSDQKDFEDNYKTDANKPIIPHDSDGKQYVRAESRPLNRTTYFTMAGDAPTKIGDGKRLCWDFSKNDDEVSMPSGSGLKRKRIEFDFIDAVNIKEGTIYFKNKLFGSYIDLYVVCPGGEYYLKNDGTPALATEDTIVNHFVNKHHMLDTCVIGDELNTEAASNEIPNNYKFWLEITVPDSDNSSKGYVSVELYRDRTVIL